MWAEMYVTDALLIGVCASHLTGCSRLFMFLAFSAAKFSQIFLRQTSWDGHSSLSSLMVKSYFFVGWRCKMWQVGSTVYGGKSKSRCWHAPDCPCQDSAPPQSQALAFRLPFVISWNVLVKSARSLHLRPDALTKTVMQCSATFSCNVRSLLIASLTFVRMHVFM